MDYHSQSDEPPQTNLRVFIKVTYPTLPLKNNYGSFEERRSESSEIIDVLKKLGATDYKIQYCIVVTGEPDQNTSRTTRRSSSLSFQSALLPSQWVEVGQSIVQVTAHIYRTIVENKTTIDIMADFANIIQVTLPITNFILRLLHGVKAPHESKKIPTVSISYRGLSINVTDENLKKAEGSAITLLKQSLETIQKSPELAPGKKVSKQLSIKGGYVSLDQQKRKKRKKPSR